MLVVTSIGKSGSTWVQKILNAHPEIFCAGEGKFQHLLGALNDPLTRYNTVLQHTNAVIYKKDAVYTLWNDRKTVATIQYLMAMAFLSTAVSIPSSVTYVGDKDTGYLHNMETWFKSILPDAKYIHVIRDCRDSVISNMHHLNRQGNAIKKNTDAFYQLVASWSKTWKQTLETTRRLFADAPDSYHEIRYEDLLENPIPSVNSLFGFLNVSTAPEIIEQALASTAFRQLSNGRQPGEEDRNSFYRKGVQGDWQGYFDHQAEEVCYREAGEMLRELGYRIP